MKKPTDEDFMAHALVLGIRHMGWTNLEHDAACIKFGYSLALLHATDEVAKASKDLREFRERNNAPK